MIYIYPADGDEEGTIIYIYPADGDDEGTMVYIYLSYRW
jgi:hypothetical protein